MTATQVLVLALLVAAFAAGWVARGAGRRDDRRFSAAVHEGLQALLAAQRACERSSGLDDAADRLRSARHELAQWVGADSPLVEDVEAARDALTLMATAVRDRVPAAPLAPVVHDARVRYSRAARVIDLLPE